MVTGVTGLAWTACGLLLAVASLGITLVFLAAARSPATPPAPAATASADPDDDKPVRRPSVLVVAAHITAACVTILLVTLAAIGSG